MTVVDVGEESTITTVSTDADDTLRPAPSGLSDPLFMQAAPNRYPWTARETSTTPLGTIKIGPCCRQLSNLFVHGMAIDRKVEVARELPHIGPKTVYSFTEQNHILTA